MGRAEMQAPLIVIFIIPQADMVHTCIVIGCCNRSNDPKCADMSWHRICKKFEEIRCVLPLPSSLCASSELKHHRICDECFSKVSLQQPRKPPTKRLTSTATTSGRRYTRQELRDAISHDHSYSLPPPTVHSSYISIVPTTDSILMPKLKDQTHFCIEMYENNDSAISCYTSFPSYSHLLICFQFFGDAVHHLTYPNSSNNSRVINRLVKHRTLSPLNEFFLTLCRLKRGLSEQDIAYRFQLSQSTVLRIFTAWVNFMYRKFSEVSIWPSRQQIDFYMPASFKTIYPTTRVIIDATEIFIQRPSHPDSQQVTFSTYKNHNTAKAMVAITPSGVVCFISKLYGGSITDRELFIETGIIDNMDVGEFHCCRYIESSGYDLKHSTKKEL